MSYQEENPRMSDMEIALITCGHLKHPCGDSSGNTLLPMWQKVAYDLLSDENFDPNAREVLESILKITES
jgi:hypothetical protein